MLLHAAFRPMSEERTARDALKVLRVRTGLSSRDVASAVDREPSSYAHYESKKFKKAFLPIDLVEDISAVFVGRGEPPITRAEVFRDLAGLSTTSDDGDADDGVVEMEIEHLSARVYMDQLEELDELSVRTMREYLCQRPDAPARLRAQELRAQELRQKIRLRIPRAG